MPTKDPRQIDLKEVIDGLRERGVHTPVLLRFNDILDHRLREIRKSFDDAMSEQQYSGGYSCVYPIKVNQQRHICEEIASLAVKLNFGLEAGSKPELIAVLGLSAVAGGPGVNGMPIICNGFKDDEFIETVMLATKLGRNIIPVVEKWTELELTSSTPSSMACAPRSACVREVVESRRVAGNPVRAHVPSLACLSLKCFRRWSTSRSTTCSTV